MTVTKQEVIDACAPLFEEAERTGKWFWCNYQDIWLSPKKLRDEQSKGSFCWGPVNWKIRDPCERVAEAEERVRRAQNELERIRGEVALK